MREAETCDTWGSLKALGFVSATTVISEISPGLSFDFGNFTLSASAVTNEYLRPVVFFTGILSTPRKLSEVIFELPRVIESREQLAAFLVYYLDKAAGGGAFQPARDIAWIFEGRKNRHILPWEADMAAYKARPHCTVQRSWLRLALNSLSELITKADDLDPVEFSFDGSVLKIFCSGQVVAMSAEGNPWSTQFTIAARALRQLPKRLMQDRVEVSCRKGRLHIGRNCYDGIKEKSE